MLVDVFLLNTGIIDNFSIAYSTHWIGNSFKKYREYLLTKFVPPQ